jgi:HlyD family secretion protein
MAGESVVGTAQVVLRRLRRLPPRLLAAILCGLVVAWTAWCALRPSSVPVLRVGRRDIVQTVVASGRVRPFSRVRLGASITGKVEKVLAREGDMVRAGQLLILLDQAEARGAADQARAAVAEAEARLEQAASVNRDMARARLAQADANLRKAQADFERARGLAEAGIVSTEQVDAARQVFDVARSAQDVARLELADLADNGAERRRARAALAQAQAALAAATARLAHTLISAPDEGQILTRDAEPGDAVQPGRVLMEMVVRGQTQLTAEPDEKNLALLKVGQKALASADAFPDQRFSARVIYVSPSVDAQRGTIELRLVVDNPPAYLRSEMTVSVDVEVARRSGVLAVPADAVHEPTGAAPWVLVACSGRAARRDVRLGARGDEWIEITSGLSDGELVIPVGAPGVVAGKRVRHRF